MDLKNDNNSPSPAEQFFSKLPCPVFITVFSSFIFVYLLGLIYGQGVQVYPINNDISPDDDCPECRVFNYTKTSITERQFRIIFQVVTSLDITRSNAWRLLRIRIYGPIFSQEMRAVSDNCGLYAYGVQQSAMHFELVQEGPTTVELYCLDKLLDTVSSDVHRYDRSTQSTLFHVKIKEVSNICRVEEQGDEYFNFFTKSNVFNFTNNKEYTYVPRLRHKRQNYDDYIKENNATVVNNVFHLDYTNEDINQMTYRELFEKVLLVIFVQSHFGQTIIFSYNKNVNKDSSPYFDLFQKVTEEKFKSHDFHNYKNVFCYNKMTTVPNYQKVESLTESEYEMLRKLVIPKDASRGNKIYLSGKFMLSDELDKENNIFYFGEEKVIPPTQSPTPLPTKTELPPPTKPESTKSNKTINSSQSNSTDKKESMTNNTKKLNVKSDSKQAKKNIDKKLNSTTKSKAKLNSTSNSNPKNTKKLHSKRLNSTSKIKSKLSNSTSKIKSKLSNSTSNNTLLSDDEIGSPTLLSYPDESEDKQFSLVEKINMMATAKAFIAIDDNNEVLNAFWMPRESPLILILPPVRTSISKAAQRINATGRRIHYVYGEKEGATYPDDYDNIAKKCLNDVEMANSIECDDIFKEMKFKYDTKKVLDIVNNL